MTFFLFLALLLPGEKGLLVEAGDMDFMNIRYPAATEKYFAALEKSPADPAIHWRIARVFIAAGEVASPAEKPRLYQQAEFHARRCIELDSTVAEGHTWLAAALGNKALLLSSAKARIDLAHEVKKELDLALSLKNDDDVTYSMLGSFYFTVGEVGWFERQVANLFFADIPEGGFEESEAAFLKAIELAPDTPRHRFELGRLYLAWGREEEGRQMLESALPLPISAAGDTTARRVMKEILDNKND